MVKMRNTHLLLFTFFVICRIGVYADDGNFTATHILETTTGILKTSAIPKSSSTSNAPVKPLNLNCTFDKGLCNWEQVNTDVFDWTRQKGRTASANTGPSFDHTTRSFEGWYLYIEASSPRKDGDTAAIIYKAASPINTGCLSVYYHMYGRNIGSLKIESQFEDDRPNLLWNHTESKLRNQWYHVTIPLRQSWNKMTITGTIGAGAFGDIAIDDVTYSETCSDGPLTCDFEQGTCGWVQNKEDELDWRQGQQRTTSASTGPIADHTTGTGHYMYIEATSEQAGNRAIMNYWFDSSVSEGCFSMWYHMYGSGIGSLIVRGESAHLTPYNLWEKKGAQGQDWIQALIPIKQQTGMISITGTVGKDYRGDIAIDDVSYASTPCPQKTTLLPAKTPDCNFDKSFCSWEQDKIHDSFDWSLNRGSTGTGSTGPNGDHTTGYGRYLYIETSQPRMRGDSAAVTYTFPQPVSGGCFSLFYHMFGQDVGTLKVRAVSGENMDAVTSVSRSQGNSWKQLLTTLPDNTTKLEIVATVYRSPRGDIAIDDITYTPTNCPKVKATTVKRECPKNLTSIADPVTRKGVFQMSFPGHKQKLLLPVGRHPFSFTTDDGLNCSLMVVIYDPRQVQRLEFEAKYRTSCNVLSNLIAKDMLISSAKQHGALLNQLCGTDCKTSAYVNPMLSCERNELVVRWATDTTYKANVTSLPPMIASQISSRIHTLGRNSFKIVAGTSMPPVIYPTRNGDGGLVTAVLRPLCTGISRYNELVKTCV